MRAIRVTIAILIAAVAIVAIDRIAVVPWRANLELREITNATEEALRNPRSASAIILVRNNLERLRRVRANSPDNVEMLMLIAANNRIVHQNDGAIAAYERALEIEKRPEIYLNLGDTLLREGHRAEAIAAYRQAIAFDPASIDAVDPSARYEVAAKQ